MRLLIIGSLNGQIGAASQVAMARGAKVFHAEDIPRGLASLRAGRGAELVMIDVSENIPALIKSLENEHIAVPVIACGTDMNPEAAVKAIKAGAKEYIPLPPEADLIAAVFEGPNAVAVVRSVMGATDPQQAAPGTIRGDLALYIQSNLIHGSDSHESAAREIAPFFDEDEIVSWERSTDPWVFE